MEGVVNMRCRGHHMVRNILTLKQRSAVRISKEFATNKAKTGRRKAERGTIWSAL